MLAERPAAERGSAHLRTEATSRVHTFVNTPRTRLRSALEDTNAVGSRNARSCVRVCACVRVRGDLWSNACAQCKIQKGPEARGGYSLVDGVVAAGEGLEVADVLEHFCKTRQSVHATLAADLHRPCKQGRCLHQRTSEGGINPPVHGRCKKKSAQQTRTCTLPRAAARTAMESSHATQQARACPATRRRPGDGTGLRHYRCCGDSYSGNTGLAV